MIVILLDIAIDGHPEAEARYDLTRYEIERNERLKRAEHFIIAANLDLGNDKSTRVQILY